MNLIDKLVDFNQTPGGEWLIKGTQYIPDEFFTDLDSLRTDKHARVGDGFFHCARIPTSVLDEWHAEGFDYYRASIAEILRRLRLKDMQKLITTAKNF